MKLLIPLLLSISLVGCGDRQGLTKEAEMLNKNCEGTRKASITIGTWFSSFTVSCEEKP